MGMEHAMTFDITRGTRLPGALRREPGQRR
jgi:hypothetical protein